MSKSGQRAASSAEGAGSSWLLLLFVGSGCSALIYEIVWFQSLQFVIGSSAISLAILLTTFMGGMCLGSLLAPWLPVRWHPLIVYAGLELAIGGCAVGLLYLFPVVERVYVAGFEQYVSNLLLRAIVAGICLLPPTVLMGATLPAIARWLRSSRRGAAQVGLFYSANILGAVCGCLVASFFLLPRFDSVTAGLVGVVINVIVAVVAVWFAVRLPYHGQPDRASQQVFRLTSAHVAIGLSGFAALGAEVVWTRELSLLLGASVYTFSLILATFLIGLALGSATGAQWLRVVGLPTTAFAWSQLAAAIGVGWAGVMIARSLPFWPIDPTLAVSPWFMVQLDIARVAWAVFPAAFFWGASFPLALATAARGQDPGQLVAGLYAANTLGAILGAVGVTWYTVPFLGIALTQQILAVTSLLAACVLWASRARSNHGAGSRGAMTRPLIPLVAVGTLLCLIGLPEPPPGLVGYGRFLATWGKSLPEFVFSGSGLSSSIAVSKFDDGTLNFHVSGKVVASTESQDMRLQRMLGHLPGLLCDRPESVLIVGCGAGVTAGSFAVHPTVKRIVICEIEPLIPRASGKYFAEANHRIMEDPRVEIVYDDARHFMLTTRERFDIITSDPIHPWVKGAASLYSRDYFELCKSRLTPGGVTTQWVPLYESSLQAVKSEIATFLEVFPDGSLWSNDSEGNGYDLVLLGGRPPESIETSALVRRLNRSDHARVKASLGDVGFVSGQSLTDCLIGGRDKLDHWLKDAVINTDRNLRLQYLAGWSMNDDSATAIRDSMKPFVEPSSR